METWHDNVIHLPFSAGPILWIADSSLNTAMMHTDAAVLPMTHRLNSGQILKFSQAGADHQRFVIGPPHGQDRL